MVSKSVLCTVPMNSQNLLCNNCSKNINLSSNRSNKSLLRKSKKSVRSLTSMNVRMPNLKSKSNRRQSMRKNWRNKCSDCVVNVMSYGRKHSKWVKMELISGLFKVTKSNSGITLLPSWKLICPRRGMITKKSVH